MYEEEGAGYVAPEQQSTESTESRSAESISSSSASASISKPDFALAQENNIKSPWIDGLQAAAQFGVLDFADSDDASAVHMLGFDASAFSLQVVKTGVIDGVDLKIDASGLNVSAIAGFSASGLGGFELGAGASWGEASITVSRGRVSGSVGYAAGIGGHLSIRPELIAVDLKAGISIGFEFRRKGAK